jgi:putative transcriptional regulator
LMLDRSTGFPYIGDVVEFEWDEEKAVENLRKHGLGFPQATLAFRDPFAADLVDDREDYGEDRFIHIGSSAGQVLALAYTSEGATVSGLFQRAGRRKMSKNITTVRVRTDGKVVRVRADGSEKALSAGPIPSRTEARIEAAAATDPDNLPLTKAQLKQLRSVPRVKTLRRALGLTQEEFATRYQIPLGTLRDWEQGRTEPDQAARAYLSVIGHDPKTVARALHAGESSSVGTVQEAGDSGRGAKSRRGGRP